MKGLFFATIALLAFAAGPAMSADLRVKAPASFPEARAYDWTGFYIGGHVGGDWLRDERLDSGGGFASLKSSGVLGGGQAGYNLQFGAIVFGVQGSVSWLDQSADNRTVRSDSIVTSSLPAKARPTGLPRRPVVSV